MDKCGRGEPFEDLVKIQMNKKGMKVTELGKTDIFDGYHYASLKKLIDTIKDDHRHRFFTLVVETPTSLYFVWY